MISLFPDFFPERLVREKNTWAHIPRQQGRQREQPETRDPDQQSGWERKAGALSVRVPRGGTEQETG